MVEHQEDLGRAFGELRLQKRYLLSEADHLVWVINDGLTNVRTMCIAAATIAFAVVGLTGSILSSGNPVEPKYALLSAMSVGCAALAALFGVSALHYYESGVTEAKYLRIQFEFGSRPEIEKAKETLGHVQQRIAGRVAVVAVSTLASLSGVAAVFAFLEAVF